MGANKKGYGGGPHDSLSTCGYTRQSNPAAIMINSVKFSGYRAFLKFEMVGLGRLNLLVGKNNTGKTSILEGLYILASGNNPTALWYVLARRGEQVLPEPTPNRAMQGEADVSQLFFGHEITAGKELLLSTTNDNPARSVRYHVDFAKPEESPQLFSSLADEGLVGPRLALRISGTPDFVVPPVPLSRLGSLRFETIQQMINLRAPMVDVGSTQLITSESLNVGTLLQLWDKIVLTPEEQKVVEALRIITPQIERIAPQQVGMVQYPGAGFIFPTRGGFRVKLAEYEKPLPIGNFGDGIWRMLAIVMALYRARNSLLLVDEIDTGLHHTVMADMWKVINAGAKLFNVQVFATTHSYDCVHSLASICEDVEDAKSQITIHRIEPEQAKSIRFTEAQIKVAADRDLEIR
jgi:AAA domain, putative AbiEii toxin, Type IV TA system/AAA ATPase domain